MSVQARPAHQQISRADIARRTIENFRKADEDYGKRLEAAVQALRG